MEEELVFDGNGVKITTARVVTSGETYATRNIASVRLERGGSFVGPILLLVLGLALTGMSFGSAGIVWPTLVIGVVFLALGGVRLRKALGAKIVITSSGADRVAYQTTSEATARKILNALNDAIARR